MAAPIISEIPHVLRNNMRCFFTGENFTGFGTATIKHAIYRDNRVYTQTDLGQKQVIADFIDNGLPTITWASSTQGLEQNLTAHSSEIASIQNIVIEGSDVSVNISTISNPSNGADRYVLTTSTTHGLTSGTRVLVQGNTSHTGSTDPNGSWFIEVIDTTSFYLNGTSGGNGGAQGTGGTISKTFVNCFPFVIKNNDGVSSQFVANKPEIWATPGHDPTQLYTSQAYPLTGRNLYSSSQGLSVWLYDTAAVGAINGLYKCTTYTMRGGSSDLDSTFLRNVVDFEIPSSVTPGNYKLLVFNNENVWGISNFLDVTVISSAEQSWYTLGGSTRAVQQVNLTKTFKITSITNPAPGNPYEVTTSENHNLITGDVVQIALSTGHTGTTPNNIWAITVTAADKFTLDDSDGNSGTASTNGYAYVYYKQPVSGSDISHDLTRYLMYANSIATANKPVYVILPAGKFYTSHTIPVPTNVGLMGAGREVTNITPNLSLNKTSGSTYVAGTFSYRLDSNGYNATVAAYHSSNLSGSFAGDLGMSGFAPIFRLRGDNIKIVDLTIECDSDIWRSTSILNVGINAANDGTSSTLKSIEFKNVKFKNYLAEDRNEIAVVRRSGIIKYMRFTKCIFESSKVLTASASSSESIPFTTNGAFDEMLIENCFCNGSIGAIARTSFGTYGKNCLIINNYFSNVQRVLTTKGEAYPNQTVVIGNHFTNTGHTNGGGEIIVHESRNWAFKSQVLSATSSTITTTLSSMSLVRHIATIADGKGWSQSREITATTNTSLTITSITNPLSGTLYEVTTSTSHGLSTGQVLVIAGVTGHAGSVSPNGTWTITVTAADKFTLDGTSTYGTNGAAGTGGTASFSQHTISPVWSNTPNSTSYVVIEPNIYKSVWSANLISGTKGSLNLYGGAQRMEIRNNFIKGTCQEGIILDTRQQLNTGTLQSAVIGWINIEDNDIQNSAGIRVQAARTPTDSANSIYQFPLIFCVSMLNNQMRGDIINVADAAIYQASSVASDNNNVALDTNPLIVGISVNYEKQYTDWNQFGVVGYNSRSFLYRKPWVLSPKGILYWTYENIYLDGELLSAPNAAKLWAYSNVYNLLPSVYSINQLIEEEIVGTGSNMDTVVSTIASISATVDDIQDKSDLLTFVGTDLVVTLDGESLNLDPAQDTKLDQILAKTNAMVFIGNDLKGTLDGEPVTLSTTYDNKINDIKNKSDLMNFSDTNDLIVTLDGEPVVLAANAFDNIPTTAPSGPADDYRGMIVQIWRWFFKKKKREGQFLKTYADDGLTVITTQSVSDVGDIDEIGNAE